MEPLRFAFPFSTWILRVAVLVLVYISFFGTFRAFNSSGWEFWIATAFGLFAILLFVGGFIRSHNLTIISAIFLALGCAYKIVMHFVFSDGGPVAIYGVFGAILLYFIANGNKRK